MRTYKFYVRTGKDGLVATPCDNKEAEGLWEDVYDAGSVDGVKMERAHWGDEDWVYVLRITVGETVYYMIPENVPHAMIQQALLDGQDN